MTEDNVNRLLDLVVKAGSAYLVFCVLVVIIVVVIFFSILKSMNKRKW